MLKQRSFVAEWIALEARGRGLDFDRAKLVATWSKKLGQEEVTAMLRDDVGLGPPRLLKVAKQVAALDRVPDRKTWETLGWGWVSKIADLEDDAERRRVEKELRAEGELKGGVLQDGAVKDVLRRVGATALLPQPRVPDASGGDAIFRRELERLVRSGILSVEKVDPYVAKVGRLAELAEVGKN